jgi:phosphoribosylamine--glycine ligase
MKLLVIGSGGREHAVAWKLAQTQRVQKVFVAPGNGGTATEPGLENVPITSIPELIAFAKKEQVHLTVVGPEVPLAAGVVDAFQDAGLKIFGPVKAAAQLEASKDFAKQFMVRHGLPTAKHATFSSAAEARAYVEKNGAPIVVKADGAHALPLATSQDHKRLKDGDQGPNTGGMGTYSPAPVVTPQLHARVMREIIQPAIAGMAKDGTPYTGFLYAGLMIDKKGNPKTLEFNCRLGDPETQPIMLRLKSDLLALVEHAIEGTLNKAAADWDRRSALCVVLAAANYPDEPRKGDEITGLSKASEDCHVFHAGTRLEGKRVLTNGGRVLGVTALGDSLKMAARRAYEATEGIRFDGMQYRKDIGHRALKKG